MSEAEPTQRVEVSAESETPSRTVVRARDNEFVVDEPEAAGGTNEGATPVEHLLGAWAGCLNVTVRAVEEDFDVEVEGLAVDLAGEFDPRKHLGQSDDPRAGYQEIDVTLDLEFAGSVDDETLEAFVASVEERCPVGDNIQHETPTDVSAKAN